MSEVTTPPAGPSAEDNAVIRHMREQLDAQKEAARLAEERAAQMETRLKEIERAKMDETERLRAEKDDLAKEVQTLAPIRDEYGRFVNAFEKLYNDELAAIPDEKREAVQRLSQVGSWPDRLEAMRNARALIGSAPPPPTVAGTVTLPTGGTPQTAATPPEPAKPLELAQINRMSLGDAIAARRQMQTKQP